MPPGDTILIVEDDPHTQSGLFLLLTDAGYTVLTADDGQQAMNLLEDGLAPGLIVMDLNLPQVPGVDVLKHLRSDLRLRRIPILVTTGWTPEHARGVIADAILHKPLHVKKFLRVVERLLEARPSGGEPRSE